MKRRLAYYRASGILGDGLVDHILSSVMSITASANEVLSRLRLHNV